ncbi:TPA: GTP pyrophosphokinase family protein [Clostridium perfringens]
MKNLEELEQWYESNVFLFDDLIKKSKLIIEEAIKEDEITINSITGRVKEKESFCDKASKDKYTDPINQIKDLAGLRIITYINSDVEKISKIIEKEFEVDKENSLDKGKLLGTDKVGYKSVHYVVKLKNERIQLTEYKKFKDLSFEIQIRTLLQHAWSEIEHDRNYKFSGVLPEEIKREFALLAGTLELVDVHFEDISNKIDKYSNDVKEHLKKGNLSDIKIDSTSTIEYLKNKFKLEIEEKRIIPSLIDSTIEELNLFGVKTIKDLDELMSIDMNLNCNAKKHFTAIVRLYMIKKDYEKYFKYSYPGYCPGISRSSVELYKKNGIDVDKMIKDYEMEVKDY